MASGAAGPAITCRRCVPDVPGTTRTVACAQAGTVGLAPRIAVWSRPAASSSEVKAPAPRLTSWPGFVWEDVAMLTWTLLPSGTLIAEMFSDTVPVGSGRLVAPDGME